MSPDRMRYLVICAHRYGDYIPERAVSDLDRETTLRDIRSGQFGEIAHVIEFCIAEKIVADVTDDFLGAVVREPPLTGQDLIDWRRDHERALRSEADDGD
jgi:hypothetical protein